MIHRNGTTLQTVTKTFTLMASLMLAVTGVAAFAQQNTTAPQPAHVSAPAAPAASFHQQVSLSALMPGMGQTSATEEESEAKPNDAAHQGVKVHGHWKLVAKNQDGTIAKTVEFENSLVTPDGGDLILAGLLSGQGAVAEWQIGLNASSGLCATTCALMPTTSTSDPLGLMCSQAHGVICVGGLIMTYTPAVGGAGTSLTFADTFTAASAGLVSTVYTYPLYCVAASSYAAIYNTSPITNPPLTTFGAAACLTETAANTGSQPIYGGGSSGFTGTNVPGNFSFTSGQVVQVTVTISFS